MSSGVATIRNCPRAPLLAFAALLLGASASAAAVDTNIVDVAKAQDWAQVKQLLKSRKTDVNAAQPDGATALAWAAYRDEIRTAKRLLKAGADPDLANDYGVTPLMLAIRNRSAGMVELLLDEDADPDVTLWNGVTPLMAAARTGNMAIVEALIDAGADVNAAEPRRSQTALMWAISAGNPDAARLLIENGAGVEVATTRLNEQFNPMEIEGYVRSVSGTAAGGYTPLMFAARAGDMATTKLLLERGADVDAIAGADGSPLVIATAYGHEEIALLLLEAGADPTIADSSGLTALHYAFRDGLKILHGYNVFDGELVCNFGGDPTRCKPLSVLSEKELEFLNDPTSDLIVGEEPTNRREPLPGGNMRELAAALLDAGADPNAKMLYPPPHMRLARVSRLNLTGATPFFLAAAAQDLEGIDMMLAREDVEPLIETAINEATFYKQMEAYADDNEIFGNGTALHVALGLGRKSDFSPDEEQRAIATAERLIARGADINEATATGWTAMHAAAYIGADTIIEWLAENGAEINVMTACGQTPMSLALGTSVAGLFDRTVPQVDTAERLLDLGARTVAADKAAGQCVLGRGGLEADMAQNALVQDRIDEVLRKLQARSQ